MMMAHELLCWRWRVGHVMMDSGPVMLGSWQPTKHADFNIRWQVHMLGACGT